MFAVHDPARNAYQLFGRQAEQGYDWWWHSFTGYNSITGRERSFFIEFFVCNPDLGGEAPVFGQLPENRAAGKRPSYLMVKAGSWGEGAAQLHRFFGIRQARINSGVPFCVEAEDCCLDEEHMRGRIDISPEEAEAHPEWMCGSGSISFDLQIRKLIPFNVGYGAGDFMRKKQIFEMFWHAEGMKSAYTGTVTWNGETYTVRPEDCYGYADKNWGKDFTSPWVWLSSNDLVSKLTGKRLENSVFDIGGGRPKAGPISIPGQLLSAVYYEGKEIEFNFSKFPAVPRTNFTCRETDTQILWHVEQHDLKNRLELDVTCEKKDMLLVNYESPDGEKRHKRLWNGGTGVGILKIWSHGKLLDEIAAAHIGCEFGEYEK